MKKHTYYSVSDYLKVKRKFYCEKMNSILQEIDENYSIKLSCKLFLAKYFQYLRICNDQKLKGDTSEFSYEMQEYFEEFNLQNFFPNQIWQFNVATSFIDCLSKISEEDVIHILILLNLILKGRLNTSAESIVGIVSHQGGNVKFPFEYNYIVNFKVKNFISLLIQVIPILYPILNEKGKLSHFEFHHEIILVGLIPTNHNKRNNHLNKFDNYFKNQQLSPNFFANMKLIKEKKDDKLILNGVKIGDTPKPYKDLIHPRKFEPILLNGQDYVYNESFQRWIPASIQIILNNKLDRINAFSENHYLIQKYSQQPSSYQLFKIIQNIPNFKVNLTTQQQEIISYNGDGLVIGRSGTGKTTCALLRLFTTDILFKIRSKLDQIYSSTTDIQLNQQQQGCQLKTVFVTASPLLACQVKRLYDKLVQNIQDVINNKKKQRQKNQEDVQIQVCQDDMDESTFQIIDAIRDVQDQQISQQLNQEDEIDDKEIDEYEKEMGKFLKFSEINQFPIFVTLRKFLFLVDGSLINSYFSIFGSKQDRSTQWHNESFGQMRLNQQNDEVMEKKMEQINQRLMNEIDNSDYIQTKVHEVTQDVFVRIFWPRILSSKQQEYPKTLCSDPIYVWSEICTKIKGHETSHQYPDNYLNFDNYYNLQGLPKEQCSFIYEAFQIYEELKYQLGYYDLLDLVNHINQQLAFGNDIIEKVHYLLLDELQDVPRAVLILLDQLTELGLFCCGDNAQNIAKGIGFKFFEVQNCLLNYRNSKIKQRRNFKIFDLSVNFRSHNKILQLANSVIRMIEILFPQKIDKLNKETSDLEGPKPVLIKSHNVQQLLNILCGFFSNDQKTVEFGCNQVIIVKDQESKTRLPIELQNVLCLTIYEAKGLEFDDVILFNFFHDSTASLNDWEILNNIKAQSEYLKKIDYEKFMTIHEKEVIASKTQKENELVEIWQLKMKKLNQIQEVSIDLCQELKQLYVAVTRPKKRLIIFDQSLEKRKIIQNIWEKMNVVQLIDEQPSTNDINFKLQLQNDNKAKWKRQGFKMFRMNNYDQAAKCFKFAEEKEFEKKSIAYSIVVNNTIVNDPQKYIQAARIFEEIGLLQRAAQCYFTSKQFQKAQELYEKLGQMNEVAESAFFAHNYQKAAQNFEILGDIRRAIDCYCQDQDWDNVIIILNKYKNEFSLQEREAFLNLFFPNYLQNLTQQIQQQGDNKIEYSQDQFINDQKSQQSDSFIIQDSLLKESQDQEDSQIDQSQIINQGKNESSLEILVNEEDEKSQSFQIELGSEQNMDHLSIYDPEDEWLKQDQKSLIKSMSSRISHQSEFSNILLLNQPPQISLLKPKNNIFISNNVLQQLIKKLQLFSDEFKNHLDSQKYTAVQLSNRKDDEKEFDHIINFIYDLENIDIDSIYMILDILEEFKSYKLCIYLCNYFKLSSYLGRYLVSLVSTYSPLTKAKAQVHVKMISLGSFRKNLLEQSAISQIAINNILETINPTFLTFKNDQELSLSNSLGLKCYQELIGLGFWKILVYQLNFKHSIDLCMSFHYFSDCIEIFNKVQLNRTSDFSEEERFKLRKIQYYQQIKLIIGQEGNCQGIVNEIDDIFQITKEYFINKSSDLENIDIDQLIINANIYKKKMTLAEKLKQTEAIIIIFDIIKSKIEFSDEKFVGLFQILEYSHKKLLSNENQDNIIEALLFCYGFSIPQGEIMSHYSHSLLIHISSKLIKKILKDDQNIQKSTGSLIFVDIGYEYISISYEQAIQQIITSFSQQIMLILNNKSQKLMDYYQVNDEDSFSISSQENWEDTLADLLIYLMLEQSNKQFINKIEYKQQVNQLKKLHPLTIYYEKKVEQSENSIIDSEPSLILKLIQLIILKNNQRIINTPIYIKSLVREISLNLMLQIKTKQQNFHSNLIMAINLLNLTDQLSFAVLILQNSKKGSDKYDPYLKYIEFLECQYFGINEDALGCFLDYSQYVMERFYLDEQIYHIIRIGLNILVPLLYHSQQKLVLIKSYKEYLNNVEYSNEKNCILKMGIFKLNNLQLIQEYLIFLFEFYQFCCVKYYQDQILQFLQIFSINLLNTNQVKIIKSLIEHLNQNIQFKHFQKLQDILMKEISKNKQETKKKIILITLSGYLEDDIIEIGIVNSKSEDQLDEYYEMCIQKWNDYQNESNYKRNSINSLIKAWKAYKKNHIMNLNQQVGQNLQFIRSLQYFQIWKGEQSFISQCQSLRDLNRYMSKEVKNLNEELQLSVTLQRKLQKARQCYANSFDIHLINSLLDQLEEQMKEMLKGSYVHQKLQQLEMDLLKWEQNDERKIDEQMLELNRQLIIEKWKNLKAGVKVHTKVDKKQLKSIQEVEDES